MYGNFKCRFQYARFTRVQCSSSGIKCENPKYSLKLVNRTTSLINFSCNLKQHLIKFYVRKLLGCRQICFQFFIADICTELEDQFSRQFTSNCINKKSRHLSYTWARRFVSNVHQRNEFSERNFSWNGSQMSLHGNSQFSSTPDDKHLSFDSECSVRMQLSLDPKRNVTRGNHTPTGNTKQRWVRSMMRTRTFSL